MVCANKLAMRQSDGAHLHRTASRLSDSGVLANGDAALVLRGESLPGLGASTLPIFRGRMLTLLAVVLGSIAVLFVANALFNFIERRVFTRPPDGSVVSERRDKWIL
jgi:hypothetical protein